jgi:hypothetical protein
VLFIGIIFIFTFCGCITYRLNGIEHPVLNNGIPAEANGWSIRVNNSMETEFGTGVGGVTRYLAVELSAKNNSSKKRKFKYWVKKYKESNLKYMLGNSILFRIAYSLNPDKYDTEDFYRDAGLAISYVLPGDNKKHSHSCSGIPESYFWGILRSTRTKMFTSDWISPGSTHNVTAYCNIRLNASGIELAYYGHKIATLGKAVYTESVKKSLEMEQ